MDVDRHGMHVLDRQQALEMLDHASIGRVVVNDDEGPAAFPVNFALLDGDVVFRTAAGTKLAAALREAVVAFEADEVDRDLETGWSVLVRGRASVISRPEALHRARQLPVRPWLDGARSIFIRIESTSVSGRRLPSRAAAAPAAPEPDVAFDGLAAAFAKWPMVKKLCHVVELARVSLGRCTAASVTLFGKDEANREVCTNEVAHRLDQAQYASGDGPGPEALAGSRIVVVDSIAGQEGWTAFRAVAGGAGIRSSLSVPLSRFGVPVGMLNLYSDTVAGFRDCEPVAAKFEAAVSAAVWPTRS